MAHADSAVGYPLAANPWQAVITYHGHQFPLHVTHVSKSDNPVWRAWSRAPRLGRYSLEGAGVLTWLEATYHVAARWTCHSAGVTSLELVCIPPMIDTRPLELSPSELRRWLTNDMGDHAAVSFTSEGGFARPS